MTASEFSILNLVVVMSLAMSADVLPELTRGMQMFSQVFQEAAL